MVRSRQPKRYKIVTMGKIMNVRRSQSNKSLKSCCKNDICMQEDCVKSIIKFKQTNFFQLTFKKILNCIVLLSVPEISSVIGISCCLKSTILLWIEVFYCEQWEQMRFQYKVFEGLLRISHEWWVPLIHKRSFFSKFRLKVFLCFLCYLIFF